MVTGAVMQARPLQQGRFVGGLQGLPLSRRCAVPRQAAASRHEAGSAIPERKEVAKATALGAAMSTLLAAGSVQAAQEVAQVADGDARFAFILILGPALAWVAFNILGPALAQYEAMEKRGVVTGLGLAGAGLLAAQSADAATMVGQVADGDARFAFILILGPALAWVAFNILGPALAQYEAMDKSKK